MRTTRSAASSFFLSSIDRRGRTIDPLVLAVAYELGSRAVAYADRYLRDTALAMDLFEESAAAVTQALKRRPSHAEPVLDLASYLYRTYLRKVDVVLKKRKRLENALKNQARVESFTHRELEAEVARLYDEVMATYDKVARQMVYRHLEGFSWNEIGVEFGSDPHAAEVRCSRAMARARLLLGIPPPML
jgi:DNA-directed RNA polymerase specialized sigma24 family protein